MRVNVSVGPEEAHPSLQPLLDLTSFCSVMARTSTIISHLVIEKVQRATSHISTLRKFNHQQSLNSSQAMFTDFERNVKRRRIGPRIFSSQLLERSSKSESLTRDKIKVPENTCPEQCLDFEVWVHTPLVFDYPTGSIDR
jgi:flagellar motor switch protein FliG